MIAAPNSPIHRAPFTNPPIGESSGRSDRRW